MLCRSPSFVNATYYYYDTTVLYLKQISAPKGYHTRCMNTSIDCHPPKKQIADIKRTILPFQQQKKEESLDFCFVIPTHFFVLFLCAFFAPSHLSHQDPTTTTKNFFRFLIGKKEQTTTVTNMKNVNKFILIVLAAVPALLLTLVVSNNNNGIVVVVEAFSYKPNSKSGNGSIGNGIGAMLGTMLSSKEMVVGTTTTVQQEEEQQQQESSLTIEKQKERLEQIALRKKNEAKFFYLRQQYAQLADQRRIDILRELYENEIQLRQIREEKKSLTANESAKMMKTIEEKTLLVQKNEIQKRVEDAIVEVQKYTKEATIEEMNAGIAIMTTCTSTGEQQGGSVQQGGLASISSSSSSSSDAVDADADNDDVHVVVEGTSSIIDDEIQTKKIVFDASNTNGMNVALADNVASMMMRMRMRMKKEKEETATKGVTAADTTTTTTTTTTTNAPSPSGKATTTTKVQKKKPLFFASLDTEKKKEEKTSQVVAVAAPPATTKKESMAGVSKPVIAVESTPKQQQDRPESTPVVINQGEKEEEEVTTTSPKPVVAPRRIVLQSNEKRWGI